MEPLNVEELLLESAKQLASLSEKQTFLMDRVDKLTDSVEKLLKAEGQIYYITKDNEKIKGDIVTLEDRLSKIEDAAIKSSVIKNIISQWWRLPILVVIVGGIAEFIKHGYRF